MTRLPWEHPARDVLARTRYRGIRWRVDSGRVYLSGATERITDADRAAIAAHRATLVHVLAALPARCSVPHMCGVIGPCVQCTPDEGSEAA